MSDQEHPFKKILTRVAEATGQTDFIDEVEKLLQEYRNLVEKLDDFEKWGEVEKLDDVEYELLKNEARLNGNIHVQQAMLSNALYSIKATRSYDQERRLAHTREVFLRFNETIRRVNSLYGSDSKSVENSREAPEEINISPLIKATVELHFKSSVDSITATRNSLKKLWRRYVWKQRKLLLSQHGFRIFWSLIILTLLIGALVNLVSAWYLSLIVLPVVMWILQESVFNKLIGKSLLRRRRVRLKAWATNLYDTLILAVCHTALATKELENLEEAGNKSLE